VPNLAGQGRIDTPTRFGTKVEDQVERFLASLRPVGLGDPPGPIPVVLGTGNEERNTARAYVPAKQRTAWAIYARWPMHGARGGPIWAGPILKVVRWTGCSTKWASLLRGKRRGVDCLFTGTGRAMQQTQEFLQTLANAVFSVTSMTGRRQRR